MVAIFYNTHICVLKITANKNSTCLILQATAKTIRRHAKIAVAEWSHYAG